MHIHNQLLIISHIQDIHTYKPCNCYTRFHSPLKHIPYATTHISHSYPLCHVLRLLHVHIHAHVSDFPTITSYFIHKINVIHTHYNIIHPNPFISHAHNYTSITHLTHKTLITYLRPPIKHFIFQSILLPESLDTSRSLHIP